ncbi:MAG TPA: hypothetical protein VM186_07810 [Planctomycetota bacterium]|nr:hypothetical protein [Planctomycetota bacterium]
MPDSDLAGIPRIIDGDLDGTATVDIGAYEFLPGDVKYDGRVNILSLEFLGRRKPAPTPPTERLRTFFGKLESFT